MAPGKKNASRLRASLVFIDESGLLMAPLGQTPIVYQELERFKEFLGRRADVLMIDDQGTGMAGWYKKKGDRTWPTQPQQN